MTPLLKIGTCGFPLPKTKLAEHFPIVEVQQTFYQPPQIKTLQKWREEVPADFEFAIKAWQLITHPPSSPTYRRLSSKLAPIPPEEAGFFRDTETVKMAWRTTQECAEALRATKVLFQCPASFKPSDTNIAAMRRFFTQVARGEMTLLWEPRGEWSNRLVETVCSDLDLVHVVDPFKGESVTPGLQYFRLHGKGGYRYQYSDDELQELLERVTDRDSIILFNNSAMLEDALRFKELVRRRMGGT